MGSAPKFHFLLKNWRFLCSGFFLQKGGFTILITPDRHRLPSSSTSVQNPNPAPAPATGPLSLAHTKL